MLLWNLISLRVIAMSEPNATHSSSQHGQINTLSTWTFASRQFTQPDHYSTSHLTLNASQLTSSTSLEWCAPWSFWIARLSPSPLWWGFQLFPFHFQGLAHDFRAQLLWHTWNSGRFSGVPGGSSPNQMSHPKLTNRPSFFHSLGLSCHYLYVASATSRKWQPFVPSSTLTATYVFTTYVHLRHGSMRFSARAGVCCIFNRLPPFLHMQNCYPKILELTRGFHLQQQACQALFTNSTIRCLRRLNLPSTWSLPNPPSNHDRQILQLKVYRLAISLSR